MVDIDVAEVRARLNKTLSVDDGELQDMLDAAVSKYEEVVGPVGTTTAPYYGGLVPAGASDVVFTDADGVPLDVSWRYGSPYLRWDEPAGAMGHGLLIGSTVTVTYTTTLPAHHREAIIADVAGYFAATQRGGSTLAPRFPGEGYAESFDSPSTPLTLFPRIEALVGRFGAGVA